MELVQAMNNIYICMNYILPATHYQIRSSGVETRPDIRF